MSLLESFRTQFLLLLCFACVQGHDYIYKDAVDMYYKFHSHPLPWYDAQLKCESENAMLAMPRNNAEVVAIMELMESNKNYMGNKEFVLIGFHDLFDENEFLSLTNEPLQYYYHTWMKGNPSNSNNEDCMNLHTSGKINDVSCATATHFVCQKMGKIERQTSNTLKDCPTSDEAYKCSSSLNKCYKIHLNPKKWSVARNICYLEGGHLAIIRNKEEEDFLVELLKDKDTHMINVAHPDQLYVGVHDIFKSRHFVTVLGEHFSSIGYAKWYPGQPSTLSENCLAMFRSGILNDYPCETPNLFICERKLVDSIIDIRFPH